jgi:hypothetical protein
LAEQTNIKAVPELCRVSLLGAMPHGKRGNQIAARQICDRLFGKA